MSKDLIVLSILAQEIEKVRVKSKDILVLYWQ